MGLTTLRQGKFYIALLLFWGVAAFLLFLNGLRYGHADVALIRNIYVPIFGAILCLPLSLLVEKFSHLAMMKLALLVVVLSVLASTLLGLFINPLTYSLLGALPEQYTASALTNQMLVYFLLFVGWSWLFKSQLIHIYSSDGVPHIFEVRVGDQLKKISSMNVIAVTAEGDYVKLITADVSYMITGTLQNMADTLEGSGFYRIHRSTLVNAVHVEKIVKLGKGLYDIGLRGDITLRSSKSWEQSVLALIPVE